MSNTLPDFRSLRDFGSLVDSRCQTVYPECFPPFFPRLAYYLCPAMFHQV